MSGWGEVVTLSPPLSEPQPDVLYHVQGGGTGYLRPTDDKYGPELSFGRTMGDAIDSKIGIVKHAEGSTSLAVDWNPTDGILYGQLVQRFGIAKTFWSGQGYDVNVAGIVWMQGEQDAKVEEMADAYESNLRHFIDEVRNDFQAPAAPFVYGLIRGKDYRYRNVVRAAQFAVADHELGAYLIGTDDLETFEGLHFTSESQIVLGRRFATAMLGLRSIAMGDANADGIVNLADLNAVRNNFGGYGIGDVSHDGLIGLEDLNIVRNQFGTRVGNSAVPEPNAAVLSISAILAFLSCPRMRKRILRCPSCCRPAR